MDLIKNFINPKIINDIPIDFISYVEYYKGVRRNDLERPTVQKINVIAGLITDFLRVNKQKQLLIKDINSNFRNKLFEYFQSKKYAESYPETVFKVIKTICRHASRQGVGLSKDIDTIKFGHSSTKPLFFTFDEIEMVKNSVQPNDHLNNARDWLVI